MARSLLVGAEIACPTNAGAATSFGAATVVRLVNTGTTPHKKTIPSWKNKVVMQLDL